jgi:MFS family permease
MQMVLPIAAAGAVGAAHAGLEHGAWRILYVIGKLPVVVLSFIARKTLKSEIWLARQSDLQTTERARVKFRLPVGGLHNALLAFALVFFLQYVYWGVFTWTLTYLSTTKHFNFLHNLSFVLALQFGTITGFILFGSFVDRLGRKPMFVAYILVGIAAVSAYVFRPSSLLLVAIFFSGFSVNGIFAGMGPFTAELIPHTPSRGFLMGLIYNGGRVDGFIALSVIGVLASGPGGFAAGLGTTIAAFALLMLLLAPETKRRLLR